MESSSIAAVVAAIVTSFHFGQTYKQSPFRDSFPFKALWWWSMVMVLDASVAVLILWLAPTGSITAFSGKYVVAWVAVGLAVPLGLRTPVWGELGLGRNSQDLWIDFLIDHTATS